MAKKTVQDIILQRFDRLEAKVDSLATEKIPSLFTEMAILAVKVKEEAKAEAKVEATRMKIWGGIGGGITIVVSLVSLAIAYFKS